MSGRKSNLPSYKVITNGDMSLGSITSAVTNIQWLDNVGVQLNWTGSPSGNFDIQVSADYEQDFNGNVLNPGNWASLTLSPSPATSGGSPIYIDINQLSAPWIRTVFTSTPGSFTVTTVADNSGSLNSKYFLINGADGTNWYVWMSDGSGIDPAIAGRTGVEIGYSADSDASAVADSLRTGLAACTSITNISGNGTSVTFDQTTGGVGGISQGVSGHTGFTLAYVSYTGTLQAYICAKMI